jgi:hypothetical protein
MSGSFDQQRSQNYQEQQQQSGSKAFNDASGYTQSQATQGNQATSGQGVWGAQQGALGDLYGQSQGLMAGTNPYGQQAAGLGQAGQAAWQQQLTPGQNPYFDQAVQASIDQATDSFKRGTLADLDARSAGVGQLGSSRDRLATGEAAGLFGQSIAQTAAQQRAQQYSGDQDRALQAIGMTGNMQQSAYSPLSVAASLIGGPTVLSQAQSSGWGDSSSMGSNASHGSSESYTYGTGWGTGRSRKDSASGGLKS